MKTLQLILLTLVPVCVLGQSHFIGIKSGLNLTNINSSNFISDNDYRKGISTGISYDYFFKKRLSFSTEVLYNQRGFESIFRYTDSNGNLTGQTSTLNFNYDYLSIPIKSGYTFGTKLFGFTNIGLMPSIIVAAKTIIPLEFGGKLDVTNRVNKFDIAGLLEIGGGYKFGRYWAYSSIMYQQSFTSLTTKDYFESSSIKHYGFSFSVGVKYRLGKG